MPQPPFPAPSQIQVVGVRPGEFGTSTGGWLSRFMGDVSVVIDPNPEGVFSVSGLETFALTISHDPGLPPGPRGRSWESVSSVDGPGPIAVAQNQALVITIGFGCPDAEPPSEGGFGGAALILANNGVPLATLPIAAPDPFFLGAELAWLADPPFEGSGTVVMSRSDIPNAPSSLQFVVWATQWNGISVPVDPGLVTWTSDSPLTVSIDDKGLAAANIPGAALIVATFQNFVATLEVEVIA